MGGRIDVDEYGEPIIGGHLLILFNADHVQEIPFALPTLDGARSWERLVDTATGFVDGGATGEEGGDVAAAGAYKLAPCSMAVFRAPEAETTEMGPESLA